MGIKKNFFYNSLLTLSQYLLGLVTFPYVSRVLGVSNIGIVSYVDNTINYFSLFSSLGIGIIGAREIARFRNDRTQMNIVFSSLMTLSIIFTSIVVMLYFFALVLIPKLNMYKELFFIGTAKLIFNVLLIEWLYKGIENFKYITIRNLTVKLLYISALFFLIKTKDDYIKYFFLTTGTVVINAIINSLYSKNFVSFSFKCSKIKTYLLQSFSLGSYSILTAMYTTFNVMYLGWVSDSVQVGYYWAALTIYSIILGFFAAFTGVMMPRMSSLLSEGRLNDFNVMIDRSFNLLFPLCFPLIIGSIILAPQLIYLLSGNEFSGAVIPMQIIMPLIMVVGIAQVLALQVLIPLQKDNLILTASIIGASSGLIFNILLVRSYGCIGTAIVLLISEITVTSYYIFIVIRNKLVSFPWRSLLKYFIYSAPYFFICILSQAILSHTLLILTTSFFLSVLYFFIVNVFILKKSELAFVFQSFKKHIFD